MTFIGKYLKYLYIIYAKFYVYLIVLFVKLFMGEPTYYLPNNLRNTWLTPIPYVLSFSDTTL